MQQRYYDPGIGAFLSTDPVTVESATGWNFCRYCYAANSPYKFKGPDGRIIDTLADIAFIAADAAEISSQGLTVTNGAALAAGIIGPTVLGATGLGTGVRGISPGSSSLLWLDVGDVRNPVVVTSVAPG